MKYLVDSDFLISCYFEDESLNLVASDIIDTLDDDDELCVTSLVEMESATVVSNKRGMIKAKEFHKWVDGLGVRKVFVDEILMILGWKKFLEQTKKGSSFIDSMNLVVAKKLGCKKILSFDKFYPRELRV